MGLVGELKIFIKVLTKWGISGFKSVRASEQIFKSPHVGYGIIVGGSCEFSPSSFICFLAAPSCFVTLFELFLLLQ